MFLNSNKGKVPVQPLTSRFDIHPSPLAPALPPMGAGAQAMLLYYLYENCTRSTGNAGSSQPGVPTRQGRSPGSVNPHENFGPTSSRYQNAPRVPNHPPPLFGHCNVSACSLTYSRRGTLSYSSPVPRFSLFVPAGYLRQGKRGTTRPAAGSGVTEFPEGFGRSSDPLVSPSKP